MESKFKMPPIEEVEDKTPVNDLYNNQNSSLIWTQNNIGSNMVLNGFFEFKTGINKKTDTPFCHLTGTSKLNILKFISESGFRKRYLPKSNIYLMIKVVDFVMEIITPDIIRVETFREMIKWSEKGLNIKFMGEDFTFQSELLETIYLKNQDQIFNRNFLELMTPFNIEELKDNKQESYFLFLNNIIKVTANNIKSIPYQKLVDENKCVWKSHITQRDFNLNENFEAGEFAKFINNISRQNSKRITAVKSLIGYLLHRHNGSHMGQAGVLYDEKPTDVSNPQGGTGKGLFAQAIGNMREMASIDGKHLKDDDKFRFQSVEVTSQVVVIDDLNKDVPFEIFFSCLTDGFTIEKKNKDSIKISPEDSPKMLFTMNAIIAGNGSSHRRRMFVVEFSDHYSSKIKRGHESPIEDEHGILFDRLKWSSNHWDSFTAYMLNCVQLYLNKGLQPYELINVSKNLLIQSVGEDFEKWTISKDFQLNIYYKTKHLFEEFRNTFYGENSEYKQRTFTNFLKKLAESKGWKLNVMTDLITKQSEFLFNENE